MSPVFAAQSASKKAVLAKGKKLSEVIDGADLEHLGLFNWGTKDKAEINRALVELVGCLKVDDDPLKTELDPTLVPGGVIYIPEPWKPGGPLVVEKTHTFKLKKRLPMPAVAITELTPWFTPGSGTTLPCTIKYRLEGLDVRADQTDVEVHVARYLDRQKESQSSYWEVISRRRDQKSATEAALAMKTQTEEQNPTEKIERPSGTAGDKDTHIWRKHEDNVAPSSAVTLTWEGDSQATKGILDSSSSTAYINSTCAPYSVLVRYYKHKDDEHASITFQEAFYPRWEVERGGNRKLDTTSLVVKWIVKHGATKKLKHGQLLVTDKHKATVCRVALDETMIADGKLDLNARGFAAAFKRDDMPYRVQIQAHSGPDEPDGLALAVMPTQVRAYDYKRVQFLGFHVKPPSPYAGDPDHDIDIAARCDAMIEAMQKAKAQADPAEDILKVFMAPEFYFRGPEGAYPVEKIETIVPKLRAEADKIEYKDWMCVFGTAIGYQKHEDPTTFAMFEHTQPVHEFEFSDIAATELTVTPRAPKTEAIIPVKGWFLSQGSNRTTITDVTEVVKYKKYKLTFAAGPTFLAGNGLIAVSTLEVLETDPPSSTNVTRIRVKERMCERIPTTTAAGRTWAAFQSGGSVASWITACARHGLKEDEEFWLTLATPSAFVVDAPILLGEPESTEITNVALVQKGYQSPHMGDGGLSHVATYKEYISHIDFVRDKSLDWRLLSGRKITVHSKANRPALPTFGSVDLGGASPNATRESSTSTVGSEINKTGIGGGVVYTMYDITFGLEVCLDHDKNRLWEFYSGSTPQAVAGDPKVQVLLIPSWGMTIGSGKIYTSATTGPVFNVDGSRGDSIARFNDGAVRCDEHANKTGTLGAKCGEPKIVHECPTCHILSSRAGNCLIHTGTALERRVICLAGPRQACGAGCAVKTRCSHPKTRPIFVCRRCGNWHRQFKPCGCLTPTPQPLTTVCENLYLPGTPKCPDCQGTTIMKCDDEFKVTGTPLPVSLAPTHVPTATAPYFDARGINGTSSVLVYDPVAIPKPDIV